MSIEIKKVTNRKELKKFILFPYKLYKGCDNWVPALMGDEFDTFDSQKNGAYDYCEADCFLAYKDNEIVGRVAAIINKKANETWNQVVVRFGWLDFIEDEEVLRALIDTVLCSPTEDVIAKVRGTVNEMMQNRPLFAW